MTYTPNPKDQGWVTCKERLLDVIAKWQKRPRAVGVVIDCPAAPRYTARWGDRADRVVSVTFSAGDFVDRTVSVDLFERPIDNLWALAVGLDAVRLNALRGIGDVVRQVYKLLEAPEREHTPWEVLEVREGAGPEVIKAAWLALTRANHPDVGGSVEKQAEINAAYEALKPQ